MNGLDPKSLDILAGSAFPTYVNRAADLAMKALAEAKVNDLSPAPVAAVKVVVTKKLRAPKKRQLVRQREVA